MQFSATALARELQVLRKGRGVQAPRIGEEIGPALRELCGITDMDTHADIREKVVGTLNILIRNLPEDLQTIIRTTLALQIEAQGKFLNDRVKLLANKFERDVRTIRRRMDEAIVLLVENAMKQRAASGGMIEGTDWHMRRFEAILRLDRETPEVTERRTIVSERDGLDQIQVSITLPPPVSDAANSDDLDAEPFFGALLLDKQLLPGNRFAFQLQLPATLSRGQSLEFGLLVRIPKGRVMRPHYVFFPERPCDSFDLRVRFDSRALPTEVRLVPGVFHRAIDDMTSSGRILPLDKVNEVHETFSHLLPGYGYGVRWTVA